MELLNQLLSLAVGKLIREPDEWVRQVQASKQVVALWQSANVDSESKLKCGSVGVYLFRNKSELILFPKIQEINQKLSLRTFLATVDIANCCWSYVVNLITITHFSFIIYSQLWLKLKVRRLYVEHVISPSPVKDDRMRKTFRDLLKVRHCL